MNASLVEPTFMTDIFLLFEKTEWQTNVPLLLFLNNDHI
jgi:hypothetical protein